MTLDLMRVVWSFVSLAAVTIAFVAQFRTRHALGRVIRLQDVNQEAFRRYTDAVVRTDHRAAVQAIEQHTREILAELDEQDAHPWSFWRPWRMPPEPGQPWPTPTSKEAT
jgi:hypothetical protein